MRSNELMVGDLVTFDGSVVRVFGCVKRDVIIEINVDGVSATVKVPLNMIRPIILTADILRLNGFEDETSNFWKHRVDDDPKHYDFMMTKAPDGEFKIGCGIHIIRIGHVHELQHALTMCGMHDAAAHIRCE